MKIRIVQAHKEIPASHQIFVLHPGRNKVFFEEFRDLSRVFLELPGAKLDAPFKFDDRAKKEIQKAHALAEWFRSGRHGKIPSRDIKDYSPDTGLHKSGDGVDKKFLYAALHLFESANAGDLVISPGANFDGAVLAGELIGKFSDKHSVKVPYYGRYRVPARRVRWLNKRGVKHDFSSDFIKCLSNPRPIVSLPNTLRGEAYDYAYRDYILPSGSNIVVGVASSSSKKSAIDPRGQREAQDLILYFGALFNAIQSDKVEAFSKLSIDEAISSEYYDAEPFAAEYEIHSPGNMIYRAGSAAKAGFVSVMLALVTQVALADEITDLEIVNKWNTTPSTCDIDVETSVYSAFKHVHGERWQQLCELKMASAESIKTETSATVEISSSGTSADGSKLIQTPKIATEEPKRLPKPDNDQ